MWSYYPSPRRKSSTSSRPPLSPPPTSPPGPIYASALAESPDLSHYPSPQLLSHQHLYPETPALSRVDEDPTYTGRTDPAIGASGGSQAPLLQQRDFAMENETSEGDGTTRMREEDQSDEGSFIVVPDRQSAFPPLTSLQPPPMAKRAQPLLVPPRSVHDSYVSSFMSPIEVQDGTPTQPPTPEGGKEQERPPIFRTASAPGHTISSNNNNSRKLLPSPLPASRLKETAKEVPDGTPIFEIFEADLASTSSVEMVKALKGHLEQVLRVQEEIGRMHLSLEKLSVVAPGSWDDFEGTPGRSTGNAANVTPSTGLNSSRRGSTPAESGTGASGGTRGSGTPGSKGQQTPGTRAKEEAEEALVLREKGVDEIMERLGALSESLRTYHTLGTPRLSFPGSSAPTTSTFAPNGTGTTDVNRNPGLTATPPKDRPAKENNISPPHIAVANLRGKPLAPSPLQHFRGRSTSTLGRSAFSRSMTTLEETDTDRPDDGEEDAWGQSNDPYGRRSSLGATGDGVNGKGKSPDVKRNSNLSPLSLSEEARRFGGWSFGQTARNEDKAGQGDEQSWVEHRRRKSLEPAKDRLQHDDRHWVESPLEMVDRSRPW